MKKSVAGLLLASAAVALAVSPVNKSTFGGVAIKGYDTVAYFTDHRPVKGSREFTHEWNGAVWQFASAEHRDQFARDPGKFAPQYGGYCAWAVAHNDTAGIDPSAWKIVDGKLYLNYDADIQKKWAADIPGHIKKADEYWPGLKGK